MFYVYAHYNERDEVKYVGRGSGDRAWRMFNRPSYWSEAFPDRKPTKVVIIEDALDHSSSFKRERFWIEKFRSEGHPIVNKQVARYWLGKLRSELDPETMKKLQEAGHSKSAIEKRAMKKRGTKLTDEHKKKISESCKGKRLSDEAKKKISNGKKGKPNGLKGRVMPEAHRLAISEAHKRFHANKGVQ